VTHINNRPPFLSPGRRLFYDFIPQKSAFNCPQIPPGEVTTYNVLKVLLRMRLRWRKKLGELRHKGVGKNFV